MLFPLFLRHIF